MSGNCVRMRIMCRNFILGVFLAFSAAVIVYAVMNHSTADLPAFSSTGSRAVPSLQLLVVTTRHGKRGPMYTFPSCPYQSNDTKAWPFGYAQLSKRGRTQMYKLGVKLRSLYNGYLNEIYYGEDIKTSSTLVDRTLMSAAELLAGLYPPKDFQVWDKDLLWQPLPIYPNALDHCTVVPPQYSIKTCPRFYKAQNQTLTRFLQDYQLQIMSLMKSIQPYTGLDDVTPESALLQLIMVWESLFWMDNEGLPVPAWAKSVYPEPLASLQSKLFSALTIDSYILIRLLQGELFKEVVGLMDAKINGTLSPDRRMIYYSGHDCSVGGLLAILSLYSSQSATVRLIHPGSALIFELHRHNQTDSYYFQTLYINGNSENLEPRELKIPGCEFPCDFNSLKKITEQYYNITDYDAECHPNNIKNIL